MACEVQNFRLSCATFFVETRCLRIKGRWIASADTPNGPSLGYGTTGFAAMWMALEPYEDAVQELLASVPPGALKG
jgi:hypothetical protein